VPTSLENALVAPGDDDSGRFDHFDLRPGAIIAGNNGGPTLSLLNTGGVAAHIEGDLVKGYGAAPQNALPIAFGSISFTATVRSATANVSVITSTTNFLHYEVTIAGETYDTEHYVTVVTQGFGCYAWPMTGYNGGKLWIAFLNGPGQLCNFSFVTYKP